jgi:mediator of RNA polymerase II transcription subunit 6
VDLSLFSVSHGHTYHKPVQPSARQALSTQVQQSREGSVLPDSQMTGMDKTQTTTTSSTQAQDDTTGDSRTAWDALRMTIAYGKEYSDDVPLVGEPGNFRFSKNKDISAPSSQVKGHQSQRSGTPTGTPGQSRATSVVAPALSSPSAGLKGQKTGEKTSPTTNTPGKIKRRKSKVDGGSP